MSTPQSPAITKLPSEILLQIISYLPPRTKSFHRFTSPIFHALIPPSKMYDLYTLELLPFSQTHSLFACKHCRHILPASKFANVMRMGRRGKNGERPFDRFCVDCASQGHEPVYMIGKSVNVMGQRWVKCSDCRKFRVAADQVRWREGTERMVRCEGCWRGFKRKARKRNRNARI